MSTLRPREIQNRIRSGQSPEQVASAAQTTVEKIVGYATPVLAERAYVAQQAMRASVRRRAGDGPVGALGEAVTSRLEAAQLDPESVTWDAWRREDGRWSVVADLGPGGEPRRAQFCYDAAGRYVVAEDDEARWLVSERSPAAPTPVAAGEQTELGDDAIEVVTGRPLSVVTSRVSEEATQDLSETAQALHGDWMLTQASDRPEVAAPVHAPVAAPVDGPVAAPVAAPVDEVPPADVSMPAADDSTGQSPDALFDADELHADPVDKTSEQSTEQPDDRPDDRPARAVPTQKRPGRSRGRASIPSWDDILLGSSRTAD